MSKNAKVSKGKKCEHRGWSLKKEKSFVTRLKSEIGKNMSKLTKICKTENNSVGHHVSTYTGVQSFVHYLLHHMAAHAYRHKFGPLTISSEFWSHDKFLLNTQVWSIFKLIGSASLVQLEQNKWTKPANKNWFDVTWSQNIRICSFGPLYQIYQLSVWDIYWEN